ncbi:MarR family winged helix-turn-helix transcriptional regulator [Chloroflexota bacterium]
MMKAAILHILRVAKDPPTISEISRMVLREPHTISRLVYRMKEQGLVRIESDSERKNLKRITMTDKGSKTVERTTEMTRIKESLSCLSEEEQGKLRAYLRELRNKVLDEIGIRHRFPYTYPPGSPHRKHL